MGGGKKKGKAKASQSKTASTTTTVALDEVVDAEALPRHHLHAEGLRRLAANEGQRNSLGADLVGVCGSFSNNKTQPAGIKCSGICSPAARVPLPAAAAVAFLAFRFTLRSRAAFALLGLITRCFAGMEELASASSRAAGFFCRLLAVARFVNCFRSIAVSIFILFSSARRFSLSAFAGRATATCTVPAPTSSAIMAAIAVIWCGHAHLSNSFASMWPTSACRRGLPPHTSFSTVMTFGRSAVAILLSCVTATLATNAAGIAFLENNAKNDDVNVVSLACAQ